MTTKVIDILLVEDHLPDAKALEKVMPKTMSTPYRLHLVSDGLEALHFLRRVGRYATAPRVDLVLLDLNLPRVSGYEVLAEAKNDEDLKMVPIIILTGSERPSDVAQCFDMGANAYVIKPGSPERTTAFVRSLDEFWFVLGRTPTT